MSKLSKIKSKSEVIKQYLAICLGTIISIYFITWIGFGSFAEHVCENYYDLSFKSNEPENLAIFSVITSLLMIVFIILQYELIVSCFKGKLIKSIWDIALRFELSVILVTFFFRRFYSFTEIICPSRSVSFGEYVIINESGLSKTVGYFESNGFVGASMFSTLLIIAVLLIVAGVGYIYRRRNV